MKDLGNKLQSSRKQSALTKKEVADALEISERTVDNHEAGRNEPGPVLIRAYAALYKVDPLWLTGAATTPHGLADSEGLYGKTKEKEVEGVPHSVTLFTPKAERKSEEDDTTALLVKMLAQRDARITALEREHESLRLKLGKIRDILARFSVEPNDERRTLMKEMSKVFDGNELLKRR